MGLVDRFSKGVARWLLSRSGGAAFDANDANGGLGFFQHGQPPRRGTRELLAAFSKSPMLRAVVERTALAVACVPWRLYAARNRRDGRAVLRRDIARIADHRLRERALYSLAARDELVEVLDHPLLDLLADPMPDVPPALRLTGLAAFQVTQEGLDLAGEAAWILERNGAGMPIRFWPVPASWLVEPPTPSRPTFRIRFGARDWLVPESEVVWFRVHDPQNPYARGTGLGGTVGDEVETDEYAAKHLKSWFYNRAMPAGFVAIDGAKQSELDRAKEKFDSQHKGFWNSWRVHWHSGNLKWTPIQQTFEQQQMSQLRKDERDLIVHTWGFPPEILGILENSNRATIDAADYLFTSKVVVPRLEQIRTVLQWRLAHEFDERLIVHYESPVAEDREFGLKVIVAAPWSFTRNEIRRLGGRDASPDKADDELPPRPPPKDAGGADPNAPDGGGKQKPDGDKKKD